MSICSGSSQTSSVNTISNFPHFSTAHGNVDILFRCFDLFLVRFRSLCNQNKFKYLKMSIQKTSEMEPLARRVVRALVDGRFCHGWFGDKSETFIEAEVQHLLSIFSGKSSIHINRVRSNAGNLALYTNLSKEDIEQYVTLCKFSCTWDGRYITVV